jgi:hypothetical protein
MIHDGNGVEPSRNNSILDEHAQKSFFATYEISKNG